MPNSVFIDTNILIYLYSNEIQKQKKARDIFSKYDNIFISSHILVEFTYVLLRRFKCNFEEIEYGLNDFNENTEILDLNINTIKKGVKISKRYKYSFYDSLVIASALECKCDVLFSEDMQDGQIIDGILKIINPFKSLKF